MTWQIESGDFSPPTLECPDHGDIVRMATHLPAFNPGVSSS
jgi:hypothetical protein